MTAQRGKNNVESRKTPVSAPSAPRVHIFCLKECFSVLKSSSTYHFVSVFYFLSSTDSRSSKFEQYGHLSACAWACIISTWIAFRNAIIVSRDAILCIRLYVHTIMGRAHGYCIHRGDTAGTRQGNVQPVEW